MNFFVIPYLLAVDLVVPPGRFDFKPSFEFSVSVNSTAKLVNSPGISSDYRLDAVMTCTPDPISLWCCFKREEVTHGQHMKNYSSTTIVPPSGLMSDVTSITDEPFLLEFDQTGVKISSCNETSERSLRMIQSIVDLLNVDVDFDGERRGASRLETVTVVNDCPVTTKASYQPRGKNSKLPGEGFFKLMSHPDEFDETTEWILEVNRTRDMKNCRNFHGYFFGSKGDDDMFHGSKLVSNVTSMVNNIRITNEKFVSTGYTEGTMASRTMKFVAKDTITVSINLNNILVPMEMKKLLDKQN